ncbi:helix-turn-helix domain-containing protein [Paenibacillus yanchengensis]|uniref:Helix-turn-helix domain-containing protein n=1 Tax=Paenibacillus yanchengensis TaxID=2035833 RepID=A0ABW4YR97_9BACL
MELKDRILLIRESLDLNASKFAQLVGTTSTTVAQLESGQNSNPSASLLLKLADVGNVSVDWLLTGKEELILISKLDQLDDFEKAYIREYVEFAINRKSK